MLKLWFGRLNLLFAKEVSWLWFVVGVTLFLTVMNFNIFEFCFKHGESDFVEALSFVAIGFLLLLFCCALLFVPFFTKFLAILFVLLTAACSYFITKFGVFIDASMIENTFKTDTKEAFELLNFGFVLWVAFLGVLPSLVIFKVKIRYHKWQRHLLQKTALIVLSLAILAAVAVPQLKMLVPFFRHYKQVEYLFLPYAPIKSTNKYLRTLYKKPKTLATIASDASLEKPVSKLLVFVIGETARAQNFSAIGYKPNKTNSYTSRLANIAYFTASSCGTSTAVSVPCMFSSKTRENFSKRDFQENIFDLLKRLQVPHAWIGTNSGGCQGVCDRLSNVWLLKTDFDEEMFDEFESVLATQKTGVIVIHLQGSHGPTYFKRYPKEFAKFTPFCNTNELEKCSANELRNVYDNTVLYTDFVLSELIKRLQTHQNATLLYISDHGESLGEGGLYLHGMPYAIAPEEQTSVPMMIFSHDQALLRAAKTHKNPSQNHIFHSILGYFGVKTAIYNAQFDLFKEAK